MNFYQALLGRGDKRQITYLPEKFAKLGKYLKLKTINLWENGWRVIKVYRTPTEEKEILERSGDYKHQREASDI